MREVEHRVIRDHLVETFLYDTPAYDDNDFGKWYECELDIKDLRTSHTDFRRYPIEKGEGFVEIYESLVPLIPHMTFFPTQNFEKPRILCQDINGTIYVLDGQLRILTALHFGEDKIKAYIHKC